MKRSRVVALAAVGVVVVVATCASCQSIQRRVVAVMGDSKKYKPGEVPAERGEIDGDGGPAAKGLRPTVDGKDARRRRIDVVLVPAARGFDSPTDVQFPPGESKLCVVLEKGGAAKWASVADGASGPLFHVDVLTESEEGLLGLVFHPRFAENGRFFLDYVAEVDGKDTTVIEEWRVTPGADLRSAKPKAEKRLLTQRQPYQNHNAGQLAFGPDGMLYIGFGDGGFANDPHGNGQNPGTWLGKMLRVDVDHPGGDRPYGIPADNPFVGKEGWKPEIYALGLRNPWRYSFDPRGRMVIADVGQDQWEEIDFLARGGNYGWNVREARHCFKPKSDCATAGLIEPLYEYGHDEGQSITGGYVYEGKSVPALAGKYLFADFTSGRVWAVELPEKVDGAAGEPWALGRWSMLPATFGKAADGEVYLADFGEGTVYRFRPAHP
ncbi:MAG TPA: PQQ-dependent sugar dehydrogenase [Myxococcales bacterium]|nr:PQQ-dependent sugar dehydrogenase [Myxococcales bacterium]